MPKKDTNQNDDVQDPQDDDVTDDDVQDPQDDADGGQDDNASGDDDNQDDASGDGTDGTSKPNGPKPSTKDDADPLAGLKRALAAERQQRKDLDKQLRDLQRKHASAEERALLEAREQAAEEARNSTREPLVKALAAAKLEAAGVQSGTAKLVGLLDLSKVDVDDDGELIGLGDQIDELKDSFPGLFAAATGGGTKPPNANSGAGSRTGRTKDRDGQQQPKGFAQLLADQVMGAAPPGQGMVHR